MIYALLAYGSWGLVPAYWKLLKHLPVTQVLAHRVGWSALFFGLLLVFSRTRGSATASGSHLGLWVRLKQLDSIAWRRLALSSTLMSLNWGLYIYAVTSGRVLEGSLGYYISPLINLALGVFVFGERLNTPKRIAFGLAAIGILPLAFKTGGFPWLALSLALTFGIYGLIRKKLSTPPLFGSWVETLMMLPVALIGLGYLHGTLAQPFPGARDYALLALGGAVTGAPLLWFVLAAKRLPMTTLGFFQYLSPTLQFILAVYVYDEPFSPQHAVAFALIWSGLALVAWDGLRTKQRSAQK